MKTKKTKKKDFDTVKTFRKIKDDISKEIVDMNFEEIQQYLKSHQLEKDNKLAS